MDGQNREPRENIAGKWHGKRYYSLEAFLKNEYGGRMEKIAIHAGFTCPNRDGTLDTRGCIFCSAGGSGEYAVPLSSVAARAGAESKRYIAYFQAYTCTYAPVPHLERLYREVLELPFIAGISVATRPDCLPEETLSLLSRLQKDYPGKFLWIELGLQTIHEKTAAYIRRGYPLPCFSQAVRALHSLSVPAIVHVILGLPGEDRAMMLETICYLNQLPVSGIKLQLLHVLKGTDLASDYRKGTFRTLSMEEYFGILSGCIEHLSPDTVIHRVTGDGAKELLISPLWSGDKKRVLNALHHYLKIQDSYQGKYWNHENRKKTERLSVTGKGEMRHAAQTADNL